MVEIGMHIFSKTRRFVRRYWNTPTKIALVVLLAFLLLVTLRVIITREAVTDAAPAVRSVVVLPAGVSTQSRAGIEISGEVMATTQGDLRSNSTGIVTNVYQSVSDNVARGTIIATMENAGERAGVAQAKAGVAQAQANLSKVSGGTREEQLAVLAASTQRAQSAYEEAEIGLQNALINAYITTNTAYAGGVDAMFDDADKASPKLKVTTANGSDALAAEHARFLIQATIERHEELSRQIQFISGENLLQEARKVEKENLTMKAGLDALIRALNGAPQDVSAYLTIANTARANVVQARTSLVSARGGWSAAESARTIAQENEALGISGAQSEDIVVAKAQLAAAQATLSQAYARLEDTYIRAPVAGTLTRLSIKPGDFVSAYQDVGLVASTGSYEIETFVSVPTARQIAVGTPVRIEGQYDGVVTSIAESIDPAKRQIAVKIAFTDTAVDVPTGTRVSVIFIENIDGTDVTVPVSALKLIGDEAFVFTIENGLLVALPVVLGEIAQNTVEIVSGISRTTMIVIDARGFNEGDAVIIAP
tara:strand:- start:28164 stop:29777 length:1614 start_codon:yes stop_codon:yes gene_type:complete